MGDARYLVVVKAIGFGLAAAVVLAATAGAQTCTTQARMSPGTLDGLTDAGLAIATAIKNGDAGTVGKLSVPELSSNFAATAYLVRTTSEALAGDTLSVKQRYQLDANSLPADAASADFSCPLAGTQAETDFSISGLGKGLYGFAMVEATGDRPWLISILLRQDAGAWKMAGLYPHARSAAGHDGQWYWKDARAKAKAQPWLAWVEYSVAGDLLKPANFATSTGLEALRTERAAAAPAQLRDGLSVDTPFVLHGTGDVTFPVTALTAEGSEDGKRLNLVLRYKADPLNDPVAARARNLAALRALFGAVPELKPAFDGALVSVDQPGAGAFPMLFNKADF